MRTARGVLVVFEGAEGVGKSTQLRRFADALERAGGSPLVVREPGQTPVGLEIRRLLLDSAHAPSPASEALLFMASRAELVAREVGPALEAGRPVLADRFFLSTYAYQVAGRGLAEDDVRAANRLATGGLVPDLTLLFDLPVSEGLARAAARRDHDRIERAGPDFHERVDAAFRQFADAGWQHAHPEAGPIVVVDASGDPDAVAERVRGAILDSLGTRWPETFPSGPATRTPSRAASGHSTQRQ